MSAWQVIHVHGCDDTTKIEWKCSEEEVSFLKVIAAAITEASEYECMPTMSVEPKDRADA